MDTENFSNNISDGDSSGINQTSDSSKNTVTNNQPVNDYSRYENASGTGQNSSAAPEASGTESDASVSSRTHDNIPNAGFTANQTVNTASGSEFSANQTVNTASYSEFSANQAVNTAPGSEFSVNQTTNTTSGSEFSANQTANAAPGSEFSANQTANTAPGSEFSASGFQRGVSDMTQGGQPQGMPQSGENSASPLQNTAYPVNDQYNRYAAPNGYWQNGPYGYPPYGNPYQNVSAPVTKPKKPSKAKKVFGAIGLAALFGLVAAAVFIGTLYIYNNFIAEPEPAPSTVTQVHTSDADSNNTLALDPVIDKDKQISPTVISGNTDIHSTDVSEVVAASMPSIVSIDCTFNTSTFFGTYQSAGAGSGIVIDKTDSELLIATNSHVISDALTIKVTFINEKTFDAVLKGKDQIADLAVIAIPISDIDDDTLNEIRVAKLGSSSDIKVGQMAIAIGNSLGYGQSVTVGYISAKDRTVTVDNKKMVLLQTDAAINPGNSGGALLNMDGEVIGINSVKYADSTVEGMGFAIPIDRAFNILSELSTLEILEDYEKGYVGISMRNITSDIANAYRWPVGVYVEEILEDSAAEKAGILVGDIITGINGITVTTGTELSSYIHSYRVGTTIKLTIQRMIEGKFEKMDIDVVLMQDPKMTPPDDKSGTEKDDEENLSSDKNTDEGNGSASEDDAKDSKGNKSSKESKGNDSSKDSKNRSDKSGNTPDASDPDTSGEDEYDIPNPAEVNPFSGNGYDDYNDDNQDNNGSDPGYYFDDGFPYNFFMDPFFDFGW